MDANANGWPAAPIKAADEAKTERLREENNAEWRRWAPVPSGLPPKTPIAALQSLAGYPTRLRLCALRWAFSLPGTLCKRLIPVMSVFRGSRCSDEALPLQLRSCDFKLQLG